MCRSANPGVRRTSINDHFGEVLVTDSDCHVVAALGIGGRHVPGDSCGGSERIYTRSLLVEELPHFRGKIRLGDLNRMD